MTDGARVAIVSVLFRSDAVIDDFLLSIPEAVSEPHLIVLCDNDPGSTPRARQLLPPAIGTYIPLAENPGYGGGMNHAAQSLPSSVEWILICNPDVILQPDSVDRLLQTARSDSRVGAVGPAIENLDGTLYPSARSVPSVRTGIGHALFANVWRSNPWTSAYRDAVTADGLAKDAGWLSGACVLVRRSAFDDIRGFDEGYFMYFEDVDLGFRLGRAGWRNVFEPAAIVRHVGGHSTKTASADMVKAHHASARRFLSKRYEGARWWPVRVGLTIGLAVRARITALSDRQG